MYILATYLCRPPTTNVHTSRAQHPVCQLITAIRPSGREPLVFMSSIPVACFVLVFCTFHYALNTSRVHVPECPRILQPQSQQSLFRWMPTMSIDMALAVFSNLPPGVQSLVPTITTAAVLWAAWRLWRFTIEPALNPDAPKPLPYLVPCKKRLRPTILRRNRRLLIV